MASHLLFIHIELTHQTSSRILNNLTFYSPSTISTLRNSLSENLSIPANHLIFFENGHPLNDQIRLIDQHMYQVRLQQPSFQQPLIKQQSLQPISTTLPSIYVVFFHHQTIHLLNVIEKKIYISYDNPKIGLSMVYIDWDTFNDEEYNPHISLKEDLIKEFGFDSSGSLFGIHQCPFHHIHTYQTFLEKFLEEMDEEEQFEFDPEDPIDGDDEWN
jgi:hypothetical protein